MIRAIPKTVRLIAGMSALALVTAACGGDDTVAPPTTTTDGTTEPTTTDGTEPMGDVDPDGTFTTYMGEPEHLSPPNSNESEGIAVLHALFAGLVDYDPRTTEPFNLVAESIETTDNQTFAVTLAAGWTFHDGTPVTADSFINSWNFSAYAPNGSQNGGQFASIAGYDAVAPEDPDGPDGPQAAPDPTAETLSGLTKVDDLNFTIALSDPDPQFAIRLGYPAFFPLPEVFFDDPVGFDEHPIGNGPYMMDGDWNHDVEIKTVRFDGYAGPVPANGGVTFQLYSEPATAYNDLLAGNLDTLDFIPSEIVAGAKVELGDRFGESPSSSFNYIGLPSYLSEFDDVRIRQALSMAIDRETITATVLEGNRAPADSVISPVIPGNRAGSGFCPNWTYNPEEAKRLWDEAGGIEGTMTFWYNSGGNHELWTEAVSNGWKQTLGITEILFESLDFAEYLPKLDNKEVTGPFRLGWGMDYPSPQNYLEPLYGSEQFPPGGSNTTFYSNPAFDALIDQGNAAGDLDAGIPFYQQAEDIICDDVPVIPMFFGLNQFGSSDRVSGVYVDAFSDVAYTEVEVLAG